MVDFLVKFFNSFHKKQNKNNSVPLHPLIYSDMKQHTCTHRQTQTHKLADILRGYSCLLHPDVDGCPWLLILNLH